MFRIKIFFFFLFFEGGGVDGGKLTSYIDINVPLYRCSLRLLYCGSFITGCIELV